MIDLLLCSKLIPMDGLQETPKECRFVVFGIRDDLLVELHYYEFEEALLMHLVHSCADFRARIWDRGQKRFIPESVLDFAVCFYN